MRHLLAILTILLVTSQSQSAQNQDTLPALTGDTAPQNFEQMWAGFDPRAEPLEVETLQEWEEGEVVLRIVRFRIGVFKGKKATLAAIYGFPKNAKAAGQKVPGLVQIHGGGQYADHKACLANAMRGYATVSIGWAGRISAPQYRVTPAEVKLFWEDKKDDPAYRLTTDWGAVDGYHAPGRNPRNAFPSARPHPWTLDTVESPRNSGWFLCALAARRALTFLEKQPEVDADRLGVYGHSMGGKLTVMAAVDPRVKAAAPSCGGVSDRYNDSPLFRATVGDDVSLKHVSCPIVFLSPANDFHGRIGDLPETVQEIQSQDWRVTCSPHASHQDTAEYEVATLLWFDQHLRGNFVFPRTPNTKLELKTDSRQPTLSVEVDSSRKVVSVDVFYTQQGKEKETPRDREETMHRFWHHSKPVKTGGRWIAKLPLVTTDKPLWAYANVTYALDQPVSGAGYYYGAYTADSFNVSSMLVKASAAEIKSAGCVSALKPSMLIENFEGDWQKQWFTYRSAEWARTTHKLFDPTWAAPENATLAIEVQAEKSNKLVVLLDGHAAEVQISGGTQWQQLKLTPSDFKNAAEEPLSDFSQVRRLKLSHAEHLRHKRGDQRKPRLVGKSWQGADPQFRNLRWDVSQ